MFKRLFLAILFICFLVMPAGAEQVTIKFGWDCNTESEMTGYYLFQRAEGHNYSYTDPSADIPCTIDSGICSVNGGICEYEHSFDCPEEQIKFYWILRAYSKIDEAEYVSGDSNEVSKEFDLASIVPAVLTAAVFNVEQKQVEIAFTQEDIDRAEYWDLFMSETQGGPYSKIATFMKNDLSEPYVAVYNITKNGNYHFVLVTFTAEGKFSANSNELNVVVDTYPTTPTNFIIIPLQ